MLLGYNTNGLSEHDPLDAIALLADIGFRSVALTVNHHTLNPLRDDGQRQLQAIEHALSQHAMRSVIETGARFLLDPRRNHQPTLMSADAKDRRRRVEFLNRCIDLAARLDSDCVSFWSGTADDDVEDEAALERLAESVQPVIEYAAQQGVTLGFEPEPGMFIDRMAGWDRLQQWVRAEHFQLTLDVGHLYCQGELPIADYIGRYRDQIVNVHIEDMRAGVHEHLMFGEGEMSFPPILGALRRVGYQGGLHVELSRHSHEGATAAQQAYEFLQPLVSRA